MRKKLIENPQGMTWQGSLHLSMYLLEPFMIFHHRVVSRKMKMLVDAVFKFIDYPHQGIFTEVLFQF